MTFYGSGHPETIDINLKEAGRRSTFPSRSITTCISVGYLWLLIMNALMTGPPCEQITPAALPISVELRPGRSNLEHTEAGYSLAHARIPATSKLSR